MTEADDRILECLKTNKSFLLDAGAGSGKTSSLIQALNYIRTSERKRLVANARRVACITFTNVAKDEDAASPVEKLADAERIRQLERENKRLREERDILRKAAKYFAGETNW